MLVAVTGSDIPYLYDLPQLQALPAGFEYRFRYKRSWVAPDVVSRLEADPKAFDSRELLLVFHSLPRKSLIPLRFATVQGVELIGPIVFVRFRLGSFALITEEMVRAVTENTPLKPTLTSGGASIDKLLKIAGDDSNRSALLGLLTGQLKAALGLVSDLASALPSGKYLCEAADCPAVRKSDAKSALETSVDWARVASLLYQEMGLAGIPMFYLLGFQDAHSSTWRSPRSIPSLRFWMKGRALGYRISEGSRATLRVLLWREKVATDRLPVFRANPLLNADLVRLEGAANLVVGKYDVLEFTLEARRPGVGELGLRVEPDVAGSSPWPEVLTARVPLQVTQNLWKATRFVLAGFFGLALLLAADQITRLVGSTAQGVPLGIRALGLLLLSLAIGSYLERFSKLTADFQKFTGAQVTKPLKEE